MSDTLILSIGAVIGVSIFTEPVGHGWDIVSRGVRQTRLETTLELDCHETLLLLIRTVY